MYKKQTHVLADEWFAKGQSSFQSGDNKSAVADFRNALAFSPDNPNFQFQLAKALSAAGKEEEAKTYFLTLLSEAPGSGEINLELARIAVRQRQMADAMRYFQGAIYGEWSSDPFGKRWQVRKEFCEYLLNQAAASQVKGELIALVDSTPPNDAERLKAVQRPLFTSRTAIFLFKPSRESSSSAQSGSARGSRLGRKIPPCKWGRGLPAQSGAACIFPRRKFV